MGVGLVKGNDAWVGLHHGQQEVTIADARQPVLFLIRGQAGQVVCVCGLDAQDVALGSLGQRRARQKGTPRRRVGGLALWRTRHQPILAEGFAVEEEVCAAAQNDAALEAEEG